MFCEKCGLWNDNSERKCKNCGSKLVCETEDSGKIYDTYGREDSENTYDVQEKGSGELENGTECRQNGIHNTGEKRQFCNRKALKKIVLSVLIGIASLMACLSICFDFVGEKYRYQGDYGFEICNLYEGYTMISGNPMEELIKDYENRVSEFLTNSYYDEEADAERSVYLRQYYNQYMVAKSSSDAFSRQRVFLIIFVIIAVILLVEDVAMLSFVRKKSGYIMIIISSVIRLLYAIVMWIVWCVNIYDLGSYQLQSEVLGEMNVKVSPYLGAGMMILMVVQPVIILCAVKLYRMSRGKASQ